MCSGTIPKRRSIHHRAEFRAELGARGCDLDDDECRWRCEEAEFEGLGRVCPGVQHKRKPRGCRLWGSMVGPKFDQPKLRPKKSAQGSDFDTRFRCSSSGDGDGVAIRCPYAVRRIASGLEQRLRGQSRVRKNKVSTRALSACVRVKFRLIELWTGCEQTL